MIQTVCDHCGQPIDKDADRVDVHVYDRASWRLPTDDKGKLVIQKGWELPERLDVHLQLHRNCYIEHYQVVVPTMIENRESEYRED